MTVMICHAAVLGRGWLDHWPGDRRRRRRVTDGRCVAPGDSTVEAAKSKNRCLSGRSNYGSAAAHAACDRGCLASARFVADTSCPVLIHSGATFRSSSGRFITNAATTRESLSHHALKLEVCASPRMTTSSAPSESPHNSYERSNTSEKK